MKRSAILPALALLVCLSGCGSNKDTWTASDEEAVTGEALFTQTDVERFQYTEEASAERGQLRLHGSGYVASSAVDDVQETTEDVQEAEVDTQEPEQETGFHWSWTTDAVESAVDDVRETTEAAVSTTGTVYDKMPILMRKRVQQISMDTAERVGTCGTNLSWYYQDNVLVITGTGEMDDLTAGTDPWEDIREFVTCVVIEDGVTYLSRYAFGDMIRLTDVYIADTVIDFDNGVFCNCESLESIVIPGSVTSTGGKTFVGCTKLRKVELQEGLTVIGADTFNGCVSLVDIDIPKSVTRIIDFAFSGCTSLEELYIPEGVTYIGGRAFASGPAVVHLPSTLTEIGSWALNTNYETFDIYYAGTEAQWNAIENIENYSEFAATRKVYYDGELVSNGGSDGVVNIYFNS